jgi:hypothetical protein
MWSDPGRNPFSLDRFDHVDPANGHLADLSKE